MQDQAASLKRSQIFFLVVIILVGLGVRLLSLRNPAITDPSEGRYAVMAQNMYLSGDWLTPRVYQDGELIPFLGKPPLHAWATATSYTFFGVSEFSARFPSFVASAVVVLLVSLLSFQFFGVEAAALSALLLLSSWLFFFLGSSCLTDPLLMLFTSLSLFAMAKALFPRVEGNPQKKTWLLLFFLFLSCGMMVKGPIAIAIPGVALGLWGLLTRRVRELFSLPWVFGAAIFFLIVSPWYLLAERANPGFLYYFFINENLLRFFVKNYGDRYGSGHVYVYGTIWFFLLAGFVPGSLVFLFARVRRATRAILGSEKREELLFALCWAMSPAIIFTFSRQISPSYVLPGIPGLALLCGAVLQQGLREGKQERLLSLLVLGRKSALGLLCALLIVGLFLSAGWAAVLSSLLVIAILGLALRWLQQRALDPRFSSVAVSLLAMVLVFSGAAVNIAPFVGERSSSKKVVEYAEQALPSGQAGTLGFLSVAPHSAYFYSREPDDNFSVVRVDSQQVANSEVPLLIAKKKDLEAVSAENLSRFREIASLGKWVVLSNTTAPKAEVAPAR